VGELNERHPGKVEVPVSAHPATIVASPCPVKAVVCVALASLSVTVNVPPSVPAAVGAKVTEIVQLPAALTELPQLLVCAKSPVTAI
jgi:hypothetical protein